jgi:hypothetical protein
MQFIPRYLSKSNPKHSVFFSHSNLKINAEKFYTETSLSYPFYGWFSPTPLGSVHVSDDLPFFDYVLETSSDPLELFYAARKVGDFPLARQFALRILDRGERNLALSISLFLDNRIPEARELIRRADQVHIEPLQFWKASILCEFDSTLYKSAKDLLVRNPLLYEKNLKTGLFPHLILTNSSSFFGDTSLDPKRFLLVYLIYLRHHSDFISDLNTVFWQDFLFDNLNLLATDEKVLQSIKNRFGLNYLLNLLRDEKGHLPFTAELFRLLVDFDTSPAVLFSNGLGLDYSAREARNEILEAILSHRYSLRDRNTSDYGSRYYTTDLCYEGSPLAWLGDEFVDLFRRRYLSILNDVLDSAGFCFEEAESLGVWFDASFTRGKSKIDPHFHTAGAGRSYLATAVLYLDVPSRQPGCGGLFFEHQSRIVEPESGDILFFPSWLAHGTTPLDSDSLRVTLNFDLIAPLTKFSKKY